MLPTKKTPPKSNLNDLTVLVYGPSKIGKCLKGDTLLIDPGSGRTATLREVVAAKEASVFTMREAGAIVAQRPSAYIANEPAQLFRLTTQTGRSIEATASHPFLTRAGWKPLEQLGTDDCVAVVIVYAEQLGNEAANNVQAAETQIGRLEPILFDHIASIEPTVVEEVYDLTVEGCHNFIANDFVVHNSTWCSNADGALFLATEAGLNNLEVFQEPIATWEDLLAACKEISEGKHPYKTIIIDTVDNAYRMCAEHVCQKFKIEHESDLGYGKGYALINNEFYRVLNKLALLPYGLFLISHSQEKEIETRTGKLTRIVPTLPEKARKIVLGMVDVILFCDLDLATNADGKTAQRRVIRTKPNVNYDAGDRTGRLPEMLELDFSKFVAAFAQGTSTPAGQPAPASTATTATPNPAPAASTAKPRSAATR